MAQGGCEILIVEDDLSMSQAIERLLAAAGWKARSFPSAEEFLSAGAPAGASLLIFDLQLPGISGLDLHRRLITTQCSLPTIFITGQDCPDIRGQVLREGAAAFFIKPFAGVELIRVIRSHLGKS